jgi:LysM repeat protein
MQYFSIHIAHLQPSAVHKIIKVFTGGYQMDELYRQNHGSLISINLSTRQLSFYEGGRLSNKYPVGVGKPATPTPTGNYHVRNKTLNPGGVLGTRWIGLSIPGGNYGIHGTNNPSSIGGYVSNGCIRMHNRDVEELFPKVAIGTAVEIRAGSNPSKAKEAQAPKSQGPKGTKNHTVMAGESLWLIAQKYNVELQDLLTVNQLANPELIYPGQTIIIPV